MRRGSAYGRRDARIRKMGLADSYAAYLASPLWASIRSGVLDRDGGKCCLCDGPASQVHHSNYKRSTLLGKSLAALFSLCRTCHLAVEFADGRKLNMTEMRTAMRAKAEDCFQVAIDASQPRSYGSSQPIGAR
jgi:hypothetical protein